MRILLYIVLLALVLALPNRGADVGKLVPVEVVALSESQGIITVRTDTGNLGVGRTLEEAFEDLQLTTSGIIYLDTAEYLILTPGWEDHPQLTEYLKRNTKVCCAEEGIRLDGIADYLSVHKPGVRLKDVSKAEELPVIEEENERYRIIGKSFRKNKIRY